MRRSVMFLVVLSLFSVFASTRCHADAWGSAWIDYDSDSGYVVASCETDTDMMTGEYYNGSVDCVIRDGNGSAVAWGSDTIYSSGMAIVDLWVAPVADESYTAEATSSVEMDFWLQNGYWDPYNYQYWTFQNVYAPSFFDYLSGSPEQYPLDAQIQTGTTYAQVRTPACPSSVTRGSIKTYSLVPYFPGLRTGTGIVASMVVSPSVVDWHDRTITEVLTLQPTGNSCPGRIPTCDGLHGIFLVGQGGHPDWDEDDNLLGQRNIFYDQHGTISYYTMLQPGDPIECSFTCTQTYSCGGHQLSGTLSVTHTLHQSVIQSMLVTNVTITK